MTPPGTQRLEVFHGADHVGTLTRDGQSTSFDYDDVWRSDPGATPLSLSMPLTASHHPDRVVTPWLWGLLPDNEAVLQRWSREFAVSASHPFGLLEQVGRDVPGAMRIMPEADAGVDTSAGAVEWLTDEDVAGLLRAVRDDQTAWLGPGDAGRWSLAGAQAKIALLWDGERWGRPSGSVATTHILKPAIPGLVDHDLNEHVCLRAAGFLGLRAARTSVKVFGEERAIVVDRYDRFRGTDGGWIRVHQEDLCQALGVHPARKYESDGGPSAADVAALLRSAMPYEAGESAVWSLLDALAFNWLAGAPDGHAKNYSVLLSGSQVRLAPLYDIASALPYDYWEPKVKLAMKIGKHYALRRIDRAAWSQTAEALLLDPYEVEARLTQLSLRVAGAFRAAADELGDAGIESPAVSKLVDAVADRAQRCAAALAQPL